MKELSSKPFKAIAFYFLTFPVSYLLSAAILFDIPASECLMVLKSPAYYVSSVILMTAGYGLWEMKRWGWYVFLFAQILLTYENGYLVMRMSASHHKALAFAAALLVQAAILYRVKREVRVPYFLPKIAWWENNPRYRVAIPASVVRADGSSALQGEILDISMGGCFVKLHGDLNQDEALQLRFDVFGKALECRGSVVWRTQSAVTHPKGIGVKFTDLQRDQRRVLRVATQRLKKISALYRRSRYFMSQEEFAKVLKELQTPIGNRSKA